MMLNEKKTKKTQNKQTNKTLAFITVLAANELVGLRSQKTEASSTAAGRHSVIFTGQNLGRLIPCMVSQYLCLFMDSKI